MSEWLLQLPVVWMALVIFAGTYFIAAGVSWGTTRLAVNERSHVIDPRTLSPPGLVFWTSCCFHRRPGLGRSSSSLFIPAAVAAPDWSLWMGNDYGSSAPDLGQRCLPSIVIVATRERPSSFIR